MILCLHLNPATKTKYITHDNSTERLNSLNIQSRERRQRIRQNEVDRSLSQPGNKVINKPDEVFKCKKKK